MLTSRGLVALHLYRKTRNLAPVRYILCNVRGHLLLGVDNSFLYWHLWLNSYLRSGGQLIVMGDRLCFWLSPSDGQAADWNPP